MAEELTTKMHQELLGDEISDFDFRIMAVYGSIRRGVDKSKSLREYNLTEIEYNTNIERVLSQP